MLEYDEVNPMEGFPMTVIQAVYADGVLTPREPLNLPESRVLDVVVPKSVDADYQSPEQMAGRHDEPHAGADPSRSRPDQCEEHTRAETARGQDVGRKLFKPT